MYIAGAIRDLHPTLFEALCLVEGLGRLGFGTKEISWLTGTAHGGSQTLLGDPTVLEARYLFVRVRAPRALTIEAIWGGDHGKVDFGEEVQWVGCVGRIPDAWESDISDRWDYAVRTMQAATESEAKPLWENSRARRVLGGLAEVLRRKGFEVRA